MNCSRDVRYDIFKRLNSRCFIWKNILNNATYLPSNILWRYKIENQANQPTFCFTLKILCNLFGVTKILKNPILFTFWTYFDLTNEPSKKELSFFSFWEFIEIRRKSFLQKKIWTRAFKAENGISCNLNPLGFFNSGGRSTRNPVIWNFF